MPPVLVTGGAGQLAHDLKRTWFELAPGQEFVAVTHSELDVTDAEAVARVVGQVRPALVINTAAYHQVDRVEDDPEKALAVNGAGPRLLGRACREVGAGLMHISTDYVFSGRAGRPLTEEDPVDPVSVYGASKAAGEMMVRLTLDRHWIVRSSGLYGVIGPSGKGVSFAERMLAMARDGKSIKVVDDQVLAPTPTLPLARQLFVIANEAPPGTYHAACRGGCSWYQFALEVFHQAGVTADIGPQRTDQLGAAARRPAFSVLANRALERLGLDRMPTWQEGLAGYLAERESGAAIRQTRSI